MATGYEYNPLLKYGLQRQQEGELPPDVNATPAEINTLVGINTDTTIQNQLNALHNYADVNVTTWTEFVAAVNASQTTPSRIHLTANITVTTAETLNLSNCIIYGHYNRWIVNAHSTRLIGNYAYFFDVLFQGANNGSVSTPAFALQGQAYTSCNFYFENCRLYNFLETATNIFARIEGESGSSMHIILIRCIINGESSLTGTRALAIRKISGAAVSLKVDGLFYSGKAIDTNLLTMLNASGLQDMFMADGSCVYTGTKPAHFHQWGATRFDYDSETETLNIE